MNTILLTWPSFNVNLDIVNSYFKSNLSSNYDGLLAQPNILTAIFKTDYSDADNSAVSSYWSSLTSTMMQTPLSVTVSNEIGEAMAFGTSLLVQYASQNVLAGITQAGQTQAVMDYCHELTHCLITGSLYGAIGEINTMLADTDSTKTSLSPFLTNNILYTYLNQIQTYLGIPLTSNPGG